MDQDVQRLMQLQSCNSYLCADHICSCHYHEVEVEVELMSAISKKSNAALCRRVCCADTCPRPTVMGLKIAIEAPKSFFSEIARHWRGRGRENSTSVRRWFRYGDEQKALRPQRLALAR
jgi:hypothetical protein